GTAQVVSHNAGATSLGSGKERANAWFVGMAPRRNPDIVVAVLCEHGGWGAEAAAPLAAQVINAFVNKQRSKAGNVRVADVTGPQASPAQQVKQEAKPANVTISQRKEIPRAEGLPTASATPQPQLGASSSPISRP
ncbi:MAG TPA: penicillin-binding transpeptidase domain-containing protein, partial [Acidobacteriaceae bacterium]|nr:penicillin-binding transpeptidase domain-containing protein [Acidobacteriaceae bacterium]